MRSSHSHRYAALHGSAFIIYKSILINLVNLAHGITSPGDGVLPETVVEQHLIEGADTAAQLLFLSDAPSDEQWAGGMERKIMQLLIDRIEI